MASPAFAVCMSSARIGLPSPPIAVPCARADADAAKVRDCTLQVMRAERASSRCLQLATLVAIGASALLSFASVEGAIAQEGGPAFRMSCAGCHSGGGNVIQPGATLFSEDLERNGLSTLEDIYTITYSGKGRMPGFGEKCTPRGQCTFGPRLSDEDIRAIAEYVKVQADQGWSGR